MSEKEQLNAVREMLKETSNLPDEKIKELMTRGLVGVLPDGDKCILLTIRAEVYKYIDEGQNVA